MKKLIYLIIAITFFACNKPKDKVNTANIAGKISNSGETVLMIYDNNLVESVRDTIDVNEKGEFSFDLQVNGSDYFTLRYGRNRSKLFLHTGDSLNISFDADDFEETIKFSGKTSDYSNYLLKKAKLRKELQGDFQELFKLESDEFIAKIDSNYNQYKELLSESVKTNSFCDEFTEFEQADLLYSWANNMSNYPRYYKYFAKKDTVILSDNYDNYKEELDLDNGNLLKVTSYRNYLSNYLYEKIDEEFKTDTSLHSLDNNETIASFRAIKKTFTNQSLKDYFFFKKINEQIQYYSLNGIDELMAEFNSNCTNQKYKDKINVEILKWDKLKKGQAAPQFTYPDINGNMVSLSDFKGKYVYIDVWATWCGPCKGEIPHLKALEEELHDKNIVFMSVSIDNPKDKEKWKKMVTDENLAGVQLFADKAWNSSIAKDNMVNGIPRFMLIDRDGNIYDTKAPRPSGKIKEVLLGLEGI